MYMKTQLTPFVKWAGGKSQLLEELKARIPADFNRYFEPFIGGGAMLFATQPSSAVINDVNGQLLNVYRRLKSDAAAVIETLKKYDAEVCDKDMYFRLRAKYNGKIAAGENDVECASLFIWLNKHCFNGLYRVNSKGFFNVPYNNKTTGASADYNNLAAIGEYLSASNVDIRQGDFAKACEDASAGDFVYFDSPYLPVSATANFVEYAKDGFGMEDHKRLAALAKELSGKGVKVLLSNNDVPLVYELYAGFKIDKINVRRSINRDATKRTGCEVLIYNY